MAQTGHLDDPKFLNYLKYLEYWRQPDYAKRLVYPDCLHILTLLKSAEFRSQITKFEVGSVIYNDMVKRWKEPLEKEEKKDTAKVEEKPPEIQVNEDKQTSDSKEKTENKDDDKKPAEEGSNKEVKEDADAMEVDG